MTKRISLRSVMSDRCRWWLAQPEASWVYRRLDPAGRRVGSLQELIQGTDIGLDEISYLRPPFVRSSVVWSNCSDVKNLADFG